MAKPLNILYICTAYDVHDYKWMSYFFDKPEYKLFTLWDTDDVALANAKPKDSNLFDTSKVTHLGTINTFSFKKPLRSLKAINKIKNLVADNNIDLVHVMYAAPYAIWGYFIDTPLIISARGSDILITIPDLKHNSGISPSGIINALLYKIFKTVFAKAYAVTAESNKMVESTKQYAPNNTIRLIRTGVDATAIAAIVDDSHLPAELKNKKYILSPRYLSPIYNVETQIAAIKLLPKYILADYTFIFIKGSDPYHTARVRELEAIEGLKFIIFDRLTQLEMWTTIKYAAATFMVPLSDGAPNTAQEALAARSPLIIPNFDRLDDELFGSAIRINNTSAQELADAIVKAITNYPESLKDEGQRRVFEHGNRTTQMEKVKALYEEFRLSLEKQK